MKNFVQPGNTITVIAPIDTKSGEGVLYLSMFGVAAYDAPKRDVLELVLEGVFTLPKAVATIAIPLGTRVYWDNGLRNVTTVATNNTLIGVAAADALPIETTVNVRLNGSF